MADEKKNDNVTFYTLLQTNRPKSVFRISPEVYNNQTGYKGFLENIDTPFASEGELIDYIKTKWGGGSYKVTIENNGDIYASNRIDIAGDPILKASLPFNYVQQINEQLQENTDKLDTDEELKDLKQKINKIKLKKKLQEEIEELEPYEFQYRKILSKDDKYEALLTKINSIEQELRERKREEQFQALQQQIMTLQQQLYSKREDSSLEGLKNIIEQIKKNDEARYEKMSELIQSIIQKQGQNSNKEIMEAFVKVFEFMQKQTDRQIEELRKQQTNQPQLKEYNEMLINVLEKRNQDTKEMMNQMMNIMQSNTQKFAEIIKQQPQPQNMPVEMFKTMLEGARTLSELVYPPVENVSPAEVETERKSPIAKVLDKSIDLMSKFFEKYTEAKFQQQVQPALPEQNREEMIKDVVKKTVEEKISETTQNNTNQSIPEIEITEEDVIKNTINTAMGVFLKEINLKPRYSNTIDILINRLPETFLQKIKNQSPEELLMILKQYTTPELWDKLATKVKENINNYSYIQQQLQILQKNI